MQRFILVLLLLTPLAFADGLIAQSPADGGTIVSGEDAIIFGADQTHRLTTISSCRLVVDGEQYKTLIINGQIQGATRRFTQTLSAGEHEWSVVCDSESGELTTQPRTVTVTDPEESVVDVTSSGVTRGSLLHSFEMELTAEQDPIRVSRVAPGDYIEISVEQGPSTITREYYVRSKLVQDGKTYMRLTVGSQTYDIYLGENATLPIGNSQVIIQFVSIEGTRADFMVYSPYYGEEREEEPEETPEEPEETPEEPEEEPEETPEEPETAPPPAPPPVEEERQGFFSWALSLLTRMFGA